eukprot:5180257-Pyramimonas_sp.AAC.1
MPKDVWTALTGIRGMRLLSVSAKSCVHCLLNTSAPHCLIAASILIRPHANRDVSEVPHRYVEAGMRGTAVDGAEQEDILHGGGQ